MNIWLVTVGEPLPIAGGGARLWRTGILASLLASRGHKVTWWTSRTDHFTKQYFPVRDDCVAAGDNLFIRFLDGVLYKKNISLARLRNHTQIAEDFARRARHEAVPDIILCSYPTIELSKQAVLFGEASGVPVLLDIRDLWPDEIIVRIPRWAQPIGRWLLWRMYRDAQFALRRATGLIAISDAYLAWAHRFAVRSRGPFDGVFTHGYPDPKQASSSGPDKERAWLERLGIPDEVKVFWFVGTFVGSIDLGTVIEAARLSADRRDAIFVLSGSGERDTEWREQARDLPNVIFTGWLNANQLALLASRVWAGIGAYKEKALMSLTNKLFEYMAFSLPLLVSLPGEARRLVEENGCGKFYEPGSASDLARVIKELLDNPSERDAMARNSRRLFERQYSANALYCRLADRLEQVAASTVEWRK